MRKMQSGWSLLSLVILLLTGACESENLRIPALPVHIALDNAGLWNTYGVHGWGQYQRFIIQEQIPSNFHYTANSYTGFGGVLLIYGMDPFSTDLGPLAYDLSCPVERMADIRVQVSFEGQADGIATCPHCHSRYNVTSLGGAAIEGEAKQLKYNLQRYHCMPVTPAGSSTVLGYTIER